MNPKMNKNNQKWSQKGVYEFASKQLERVAHGLVIFAFLAGALAVLVGAYSVANGQHYWYMALFVLVAWWFGRLDEKPAYDNQEQWANALRVSVKHPYWRKYLEKTLKTTKIDDKHVDF